MTDTAPARPLGKNAFMFVLVTVFLDNLAYGLIIPVIPSLVQDLTGAPPENATLWIGALSATYALMNFLMGPLLGALSDRFGRRPVLLGSLALLGLDFLVMAVAPSIWILFIGRALSGVAGATFATANAYIADTTSPEDRGRAFGTIGAAFGLGFIFGPILGGLIGEIDHRLPFYCAALLCGLNVLYGLFVLPESLPPERRRTFQLSRANPLGAARHFSKLPHIAWFLVAGGVYFLAHTVYPATWSVHGAIRYDWTPFQIGLSLGLVGLGAAVVQAGLMSRILKRFGLVQTATFGLCLNMAAMTGYAFAVSPVLVFLLIPVSALGGVATPSINAIMSRLTPADAQGELQGASSSLNALGMILGPLTMNGVLYLFTHDGAPVHFAGAAFLLGAVLTGLALLIFRRGLAANRAALPSLSS